MSIRSALLLPAALLASAAFAQTGGIGALKIDPATVKVGQEVKVTVSAEGEAPGYCGLRIEFGDGDSRDIKIDGKEMKFPVTVTKVYSKPATIEAKALGKKVTTHLPCPGQATATVTIQAAAPAAPEKPAGPACPEGYAMKGKVGKAGDFTCAAGKGAKKPEKVLECKDGLEYFQTKSSLGCRKVKAAKK
ncbi:MAG: hypothetical protein JNM82_11220 [Rhodocyclaceae bacterium]|nr:hypothetical protein [Rhodocyclaceae bacterium]